MTDIVIAFDGSASARAALQRAAELIPSARATVVTVARGFSSLAEASSAARVALPDEVIRTAVQRLGEDALAHAREVAEEGSRAAAAAGLQATAQVVTATGSVWPPIVEVAQDGAADAIVCGTHGQGAVARAVVGSVASGVVAHAGRPVLVVPAGAPPADGPVLLAYDGSDAADEAVATAGRLFAGREAVVLRVWRSPIRHSLTGAAMVDVPAWGTREMVEDIDGIAASWAQQLAADGVALAERHGLSARPMVAESEEPVAAGILRAADELGAAVVVTGRRGRSALAGTVFGSVSSALLHAAERPLLVA